MSKPRATYEQSEEFAKKIIGKSLEQAEFMTHSQPYELGVYDSKGCFSVKYDVSRILVDIEKGFIVGYNIG